jgi:hypothetical protein
MPRCAVAAQILQTTSRKGEHTAQACVKAFYEKVIKVKADVAAFLD